MADLKHIRTKIAELAQRRKNVDLSEVEWVIDHLGKNGYDTARRSNGHGTIFRVGSERFGACNHHRGTSQIKACYVDDFLDAMENLGLYES